MNETTTLSSKPIVSSASEDDTFVIVTENDVVRRIKLKNFTALPAVTAADNGKFLRVADAAWVVEELTYAENESF